MFPRQREESMTTVRLEAFSDAVIAIIITIMVLDLKVPHGTHLADLVPLLPIFLSYVLSFLYVGIYWNTHHHLLQTCEDVTGSILWANLHLLFGFLYSRLLQGGWEKTTTHLPPPRSMPVCS
jgi:uncharacterized membrane protein